MYFKAFLKKNKTDILIYSSAMILGCVSSYIFVNGPVMWTGPIGCITGYTVLFFREYRKFKRNTKKSNKLLHNRGSFKYY